MAVLWVGLGQCKIEAPWKGKEGIRGRRMELKAERRRRRRAHMREERYKCRKKRREQSKETRKIL